jgi:hypothetical protein
MILTVIMILSFFSIFCTAQIGIRYILPIMPFVFVFVGKAACNSYRVQQRSVQLSIPILLAWYSLSCLSFHPHYLSYFNELIGDRKNMYKYLADSNVDWGQSQFFLTEYLKDNSNQTIFVKPSRPTEGVIVVNVNDLVGVTVDPSRYEWLRKSYEPTDHIAYSWLVYELPSN